VKFAHVKPAHAALQIPESAIALLRLKMGEIPTTNLKTAHLSGFYFKT
jgi:hypothetical protein